MSVDSEEGSDLGPTISTSEKGPPQAFPSIGTTAVSLYDISKIQNESRVAQRTSKTEDITDWRWQMYQVDEFIRRNCVKWTSAESLVGYTGGVSVRIDA